MCHHDHFYLKFVFATLMTFETKVSSFFLLRYWPHTSARLNSTDSFRIMKLLLHGKLSIKTSQKGFPEVHKSEFNFWNLDCVRLHWSLSYAKWTQTYSMQVTKNIDWMDISLSNEQLIACHRALNLFMASRPIEIERVFCMWVSRGKVPFTLEWVGDPDVPPSVHLWLPTLDWKPSTASRTLLKMPPRGLRRWWRSGSRGCRWQRSSSNWKSRWLGSSCPIWQTCGASESCCCVSLQCLRKKCF